MKWIISGLLVLVIVWCIISVATCSSNNYDFGDLNWIPWYEKMMLITTYIVVISLLILTFILLTYMMKYIIFDEGIHL